MPDCIYVLCVKGLFGYVRPFAYFRDKDSADRVRAEWQAKKRFKRYVVKAVSHSLSDRPKLYFMEVKR